MTRRVVAVFTGNRAEYGLQFPILRAIAAHPDLDYRLLVSGAHLDKDFGSTLDEIMSDGFTISSEVQIDLPEDSLYGTAIAIGNGIVSATRALARCNPDLLVVYADRFEGFAALVAGTQMGIPTAHVEGGDVTQGGALDDSIRHAMTKLAHLHFATNQEAANRILAMGEEPFRVFNVGFPAIDLIAEGQFAPVEAVRARFHLVPDRPVIVFTQHSIATQYEHATDQIRPALGALESVARDGYQVIVTYPNNDAGGRRIIAEIERFRGKHVPGVQFHKSVGRHTYHGLINLAGAGGTSGGACVGNSSSGIKETPAFGCPTVDIGSRQLGRLSANNILHVGYDEDEIRTAIHRCVKDAEFVASCRACENPYGNGGAGMAIAEVLASVEMGHRLLTKQMTLSGV
jgi:UDP-hydrolysing UDP-N-acetyl-D-glucosamine 2-epimerase